MFLLFIIVWYFVAHHILHTASVCNADSYWLCLPPPMTYGQMLQVVSVTVNIGFMIIATAWRHQGGSQTAVIMIAVFLHANFIAILPSVLVDWKSPMTRLCIASAIISGVHGLAQAVMWYVMGNGDDTSSEAARRSAETGVPSHVAAKILRANEGVWPTALWDQIGKSAFVANKRHSVRGAAIAEIMRRLQEDFNNDDDKAERNE